MVVASTSQRKGGDPPLDEFLSVEKKRRKRRGPRPRDILPSHCRPAFFICIQCRRRHPRGFEPFPALSTRRIIRMSFNMAAHSKLPNERANRANACLLEFFLSSSTSFPAERKIGGNWNERDFGEGREGRLKASLRNNVIWWQQLRFMKSNPNAMRERYFPSVDACDRGKRKGKKEKKKLSRTAIVQRDRGASPVVVCRVDDLYLGKGEGRKRREKREDALLLDHGL